MKNEIRTLADAREAMAKHAVEVSELRVTVRTMQRILEEETRPRFWNEALQFAKKILHASEVEHARLASELDWKSREATARAALEPPTLDLRLDATAEELEADLLAIEVTSAGAPMFGGVR